MPAISLQTAIIYGPVLSRRLGRSLGINLLPASYKVCSFNCVYCQYGYTFNHTLAPKYSELPSVSEVLSAVEKALKKPRTVENLTFSGNGEPTLHPNFLEIVGGVSDLRDHYRPDAKLALLSNATMINAPHVAEAINQIDLAMLKLDAGDAETFSKINHPVATVRFTDIVEGLKEIRPAVIQSVLIDGKVSNTSGYAYESWANTLASIHPQEVHIYSTERPTASLDVKRVPPHDLIKIQHDLRTRFNLTVEAFWQSD